MAALSHADLSDANTLKLLTDLRKKHPTELAAAALETARLRLRGREKFGTRADSMFFTRDALEQATDSRASRARFADLDTTRWVLDLGCGIGGDSLTLTELGARVVGVELDPLRLALARVNVPAMSVIQADLRAPLPIRTNDQNGATVFFDPARRANGKRIFSLNDYLPSLDIIETWQYEHLLVKLSPGVDLQELAGYQRAGDGVLFISLDGDLKEAVLSRRAPELGLIQPAKTALVVEKSGVVHRWESSDTPADVGVQTPRGWLYEPDPAIIRAGLVQDLGAELGATLIDSTIAYLTGDQPITTPFARFWRIIDWMPFNLKKLKEYLRVRQIGRITVKKRGSPITPEELIAKLKPNGEGDERVIVLTRVQDQPAILICMPPGI